jgi:hypothetical protein
MKSTGLRREVLHHYDSHLGRLNAKAKKYLLQPENAELVVAAATGRPLAELTTFVTIGLCEYEFNFPHLVRRGEIALVLSQDLDLGPDLAFAICQQILAVGDPPVAGMTLGAFTDSIAPGRTRMSGFYLTTPGFFDEDFEEFKNEENQLIQLWLAVPIFAEEARWARSHGRQAFEAHFDDQGLDLTSIRRQPITLPE